VSALVRGLEDARAEAAREDDERVHFVPLENATAEEVAQALGPLTGATVTMAGPAPGSGAAAGPAAVGRLPPPIAPATPAPAGGASGAPPGANSRFEADLRIVADRPSNTLIVEASQRDFDRVRPLIRKLDHRRRQVLIEATIVELTAGSERDLGVSFHSVALTGGAALFGGSNAGPTALALRSDIKGTGQQALLQGVAQGLAFGALGAPFEALPGLSIPSFGAFLTALTTSNHARVLATPSLVTMENETAVFVDGQNLPFPTTQAVIPAGQAPSLLGPSVSIDHRDVGLTLRVTPQVSEGGMVRLHLQQDAQDVTDPNYNQSGPATTQRKIETVVSVEDGQPMVLGGLVTEHEHQDETKVPVLGDVPLLGILFRYSKKSIERTNLLVFLIPHIIRDRTDLKRIYEQKQAEQREFAERYAFAHQDHEPHAKVDYRRSRGVLAEIERTAEQMDAEDTARERLERQAALPARAIDPP
jgi:general secretion pathway protein D